MEDKEKVEGIPSGGNEWEVVSLTASTYAAAPGPKGVEVNDDNADNNGEEEKPETSNAMFMSGHFVFPPNQHENLPLDSEPDGSNNAHKERGNEHVDAAFDVEEKDKFDKAEEGWDIEGLTVAHEFPGLQVSDEKSNWLGIHGTEFDESTGLEGFNIVGREQTVFGATKFSSFHSETTIGGSTLLSDEKPGIPDLIEPSEQDLDLADIPQSPKPREDNNYDESHLPFQTWWKRQAACLYAHVKEVNSFWSICIAAAAMGLVVLGHRWQQERWRALHLKYQFSIGDMKTGRVMGPLSRFKGVIAGVDRRGSSVGTGSSAEV